MNPHLCILFLFNKSMTSIMNIESRERNYRSCHSQIFFKIGVYKNFESFTGKHLCWSLFLIKLQTWRPATLLRRDYNTGAMRKKPQKQSFADIHQNRCSWKFHKFCRKTPVLESLLNKSCRPEDLQLY